jgi:hypothetical protein
MRHRRSVRAASFAARAAVGSAQQKETQEAFMSPALPVPCPTCDRTLRLPGDAAGKKVKCSGCGAVLRIGAGADGLTLSPIGAAAAAPAAVATTAPATANHCPGCGEAVQPGDTFCNHCGIDLAEASAIAARKAENRAISERRRGSRAQAGRYRKILSAARILLVLGALLLVAGTFQGFATRAQASELHARLDSFDPDKELEIEGETVTVSQLRREIDFEVVRVFGLNYLVAGIMLGLFFWARRSPFPAMLTGLCVYLVLVVINAIVDPTTLLQGVLWKVLIIGTLVGGMNAALGERAALRAVEGRSSATGRLQHRSRTAT